MNSWAAWIGILLGMLSGAAHGLYFHNPDWLGVHASWSRRLTRLGHISFLGLAIINLAFSLTVDRLIGNDLSEIPSSALWSSYLFIAGAILMPLVCYLAVWPKSLRHPFALPVTSLYDTLNQEGRLSLDGQWDRNTLFDINFKPTHMTVFKQYGQAHYRRAAQIADSIKPAKKLPVRLKDIS